MRKAVCAVAALLLLLAVSACGDAGVRDVTLRLYPGGRHEMFNETNRDEVYVDLIGWLNEKAVKDNRC